MKKVCILSVMNIKHMSLISLYTDYLEENNIEYDIIYVDKYGEDESIGAKKKYKYSIKIDRNLNKFSKILKYLSFKKYAQNILRTNKYDFLIVWRTETALLFLDYLINNMKDKYCINIRDYAMENIKLIKYIIGKLVKKSKFTTISSEKFREFLPNYKYIMIDSYNESIIKKCKQREGIVSKGKPIRICFLGYVRFFEQDKMLLNELSNDERFIIQFFGSGSDVLKEYAKKNNIRNVEFRGNFNVEETNELLERADIINNLYGFGNIALDTAISIKFYYSVYLNIPIMIFDNTYMKELCDNDNFGFVVKNSYEGLGDRLYSWYHNINFNELKKFTEAKKSKIIENKDMFYNELENVFKEEF